MALVNSAEKTKYLDRIEDEIKSYEIQYDTGHRVLDTILTGKSLLCQEQGITLTCVADGHLLDFMDEMNICVLFGNALDNAMESVGKLADQSKRLIHVSVARKKCFACIQIENCFAGEVQFVDGLPKTTKADAGNHGIGLKSIRQIVAEYDGAMTASTRGQWFELNLMIPLKTAM